MGERLILNHVADGRLKYAALAVCLLPDDLAARIKIAVRTNTHNARRRIAGRKCALCRRFCSDNRDAMTFENMDILRAKRLMRPLRNSQKV